MMLKKTLIGSVLAFAAIQAHAIPIVGTSSGSFANVLGCAWYEQCGISGAGNSTVTWGGNFLQPPSMLTADSLNINATTDAFGVVIGQLTWYNAATLDLTTADVFGVDWTLNIAFSAPTASADSEVFNLRISNPTNPSPDLISGFTLADLSNLSFVLDGVTMSGLTYDVVDWGGNSGASGCSGSDTALAGSTWSNCERNTASLLIKANFTANATTVPEPGTLALLSVGLLGMSAAYRRRRRALEQ
jgi:hypothetical protein